VGHESDVTFADFVADVRAPTPSAAAELVIARADEFSTRIDRLAERLHATMRGRLYRLEARLRTLDSRRGFSGFPARLALRARRVDEWTFDLRRAVRRAVASRERTLHTLRLSLEANNVRSRLLAIRGRVSAADERLHRAAASRVGRERSRFVSAAGRLEALSPLAVLGRGYALCWDASHASLVRDARAVEPGQRVHVRLDHGELACDVVTRTLPDTDSTTPE
jgi:exodeoxyribonuclease VII large subunit